MAVTDDERSRTGGEWVVEALRAEGVRHVFGIPGVHNLAVYDALMRDSRGIAHVLARHEQGAAFNDERYGAIKYLQEAMFAGRSGETELANPDFVALARAFGAAAARIEDLDDLAPALAAALGQAGPTLLELRMGVLPPWEI